MKKYFVIFLIIVSSDSVFGQSDTSILNAYYEMKVNDSISKNYLETFLLCIGKKSTSFTSVEYNSLNANKQNEIKIDRNSQQGIVIDARSIGGQKRFVKTKIFRDFLENKYKTEEELLMRYLVVEEINPIDWKIENDTILFSGFSCQKATCMFLGRHYNVYFTTQIPIPFGPWKLGGLPGLIAKAEDDDKEFAFTLKYIEDSTSKKMPLIYVPKGVGYKLASRKDIITQFQAMQEDRVGYIKSQTGLNFEFKSTDGNTSGNGVQKVAKAFLPMLYRIEKL
jgi:GLPGLI family protein